MGRPSNEYINKLYNCHKLMFDFIDNSRSKMGRTLLNVGLSKSSVDAGTGWVDYFTKDMTQPFEKMYVLELNKDNADFFSEKFKNNPLVSVIYGDARTATKHIKNVDSVFWFHGPEHIRREELPLAFTGLNSVTSKSMIWVCPWGNYYRINIGEYEEDHHWYFPENEDFSSLGFKIFNDGGLKNTGDANINAYLFK